MIGGRPWKNLQRWGLKQHEATIFHWIGLLGKISGFYHDFFLGLSGENVPIIQFYEYWWGIQAQNMGIYPAMGKGDGETDRPDR
jgi:hypothetical protein